MHSATDNRSFLGALLGDGRPTLVALAIGLLVSGSVALFLAATGDFLPHDERFLGMTAKQLCEYHGCRVVHFMIHDRAAFGGVLLAIALLYLWLVEFPLRVRLAWAWWALMLSGAIGFASFLAYLVFGYLDTWHAIATSVLVPCYVIGLKRSRLSLSPPVGLSVLAKPSVNWPWQSLHGLGRACLLMTAMGIIGAGFTILAVGMTAVFVPQDLEYMGVRVEDLHALNPRLVPLIAHDRAGFGGALFSCGIALFLSVWCGKPSRSLWQVLALAGIAGFVPAIGVHLMIGYTDLFHLAPAVTGAGLFAMGLALTYRRMVPGEAR